MSAFIEDSEVASTQQKRHVKTYVEYAVPHAQDSAWRYVGGVVKMEYCTRNGR